MYYEELDQVFTIWDGLCILLMVAILVLAIVDYLWRGADELASERADREYRHRMFLEELDRKRKEQEAEHDRKLLEKCKGDQKKFEHLKRMEDIDRKFSELQSRGGKTKWHL